ncbi:MAG: peptidase C1 [Deltaproteobacteria bacterium]|nr:peptidase C1 [Deltaproteobacteria bacterium]
MKTILSLLLAALLAVACEAPAPEPSAPPEREVAIRAASDSGQPGVTLARYVTRPLYPVLEELRERDRAWQDEQSTKSAAIRKRTEEDKEKKRKSEQMLLSCLPEPERPRFSDFRQIPHLPPAAQYFTGTCWSFCTTSFLESEVLRITGKRIKLAEMAPVYYEYQAKAARYLAERGESLFAEGSESKAVLRMWAEHGAWPLSAYPGAIGEDSRHDHQRLFREMEALLKSLADKDLWDIESGQAVLRVVLDRHLGRPPAEFDFEDQRWTPERFLRELVQIRPDDYVEVMSTLAKPFWTQAELEVPDNWWHDASYYNVPLDDFYAAIQGALEKGYSLSIAVDVTEPGKDAEHDVMFVPDFDIPPARIDQLAREYRLAHGVTTDDHGVHLVGSCTHAGHDWFLVKDSGRSSRLGAHEGYYFLRDDYVKLKVMAFTVHRDAVPDLLARVEKKRSS